MEGKIIYGRSEVGKGMGGGLKGNKRLFSISGKTKSPTEKSKMAKL